MVWLMRSVAWGHNTNLWPTELVELWDAGFTFYAADFWAIWDLSIIAVGISFFVSRMIGLSTDNHVVTDTAFDILALEALLLVPR